MNEETIDYRLTQIEKKLDTVTNLLLTTQAQEIRLNTLEKIVSDLKNTNKKNLDRWLNPLIAAAVSGLVTFIFIKVGLK